MILTVNRLRYTESDSRIGGCPLFYLAYHAGLADPAYPVFFVYT
jgi:hypothetical protein